MEVDDQTANEGNQSEGVTERPAWMAQLPDDFKQNETLSSYKTLGELGSKFLEFDGKTKELSEKLSSAIPKLGENATPDEVVEYRKAIGVPETPDGYEVKRPEIPEGMVYDEVLEKKFKENSHKLGLTPSQVNGLYDMYSEYNLEMIKQIQKSAEDNRQKSIETLKDIWKGDTFNENKEKAIRSFYKFVGNSNPPEKFGGADGIKEHIEKSGIGDDPVMVWFFSKTFDLIGDDKFIKGSPSGNKVDVLDEMFPSMAKQK